MRRSGFGGGAFSENSCFIGSGQKQMIINLYKSKIAEQPSITVQKVVKLLYRDTGIGQNTIQTTIADYKNAKPIQSPNKKKDQADIQRKSQRFRTEWYTRVFVWPFDRCSQPNRQRKTAHYSPYLIRRRIVNSGQLVFESKKGSADYHDEMTGDSFFDWIKGAIPLLKHNSVVVMDNAPYHSVKAERCPTMG
ncbi:hypothetical protein AGLY_016248 [Aphis glycines]|uniref:Tc1-like transposase DDE domain-containing protein n=1 Tax=Aphis glycines TaxID=307491 RepID=A0A6G0SY23_APHGL|nr:hypothetical protein AGLY_016248 [Aphis glycines]